MKFLCDVPEGVYKAYLKNNTIGRNLLSKECEISDRVANTYAWLFRNGTPLYHGQSIEPDSGETILTGLLPDIHFPYHDERALSIAIDYLHKVGVKQIVIQGDGADCYAVSYWQTDPLRMQFYKEVNETKLLIDKFFGPFGSDVKKIWLAGNHERRLESLLWGKARELAGLEALTIPRVYGLQDAGFEYVCNMAMMKSGLEPFKIGHLYVLHGHEVKISTGAVNFAKLHYDKNPVTQVNAHHHQSQEQIVRKMDLTVDGSWALGCLCDLHPEYAPANRWNHGFGIVEHDSTGDFSLRNLKIIGGKVL